jgi:hypothetical protein
MMDFSEEDFVIRVRPGLDGEEWTGEVDICIVSSGENPLDDEGYGQLMHFCKMMCASVPIMEMNEHIRNVVHSYVIDVVDNDIEPMVEEPDKLVVTGEDGNVVRLDFSSKTKGSA